jgi:hypothetical protein
MRRDITTFGRGGRQQVKRSIGVRRMDDVLQELLALYSARFPQYKIVLVSPARQPEVGPR